MCVPVEKASRIRCPPLSLTWHLMVCAGGQRGARQAGAGRAQRINSRRGGGTLGNPSRGVPIPSPRVQPPRSGRMSNSFFSSNGIVGRGVLFSGLFLFFLKKVANKKNC